MNDRVGTLYGLSNEERFIGWQKKIRNSSK